MRRLTRTIVAITLAAQSTMLFASQDPPLARELVITVKSFCQQFESQRNQRNEASAIAQCIELINSGVSQGRFRFDRIQAGNCLDSQKAAKPTISCTQVLLGTKGKGDKCESSNDCMMPYICQGAQASQNGTCNHPLEAGSACDDEAVYASKFFAASNRGVCAPGLKCAVGRKQVCVKE